MSTFIVFSFFPFCLSLTISHRFFSLLVSIPSQTLLMILLHLFTPCRYLFLVSISSAPHQTSSSLHHFLHHCLDRYLLTILTNLHLNISSVSVSIPPVSSTFFCLFVFLAFLPPPFFLSESLSFLQNSCLLFWAFTAAIDLFTDTAAILN